MALVGVRRDSITRGRAPARATLQVATFVLATAALVAWFSYASIHAFAPNADGATVVLEGSSVLHSHPLLGGWWLSLDSFWTVDVPFYALGVALFGVRPELMHWVPALLAALCVTTGAGLVYRGSQRRAEWIAGMGIIVGTLVALSHTGAYFLLQGPWHVGTTLYCLLAFALLARPGWSVRFWGGTVLLALGLNGDLQTLAIGVAPVALCGLLAMARRRTWRAGIHLVVAGVVSTTLAEAIRKIAVAIGTFKLKEHHRTVRASQVVADVHNFAHWSTALFGVHLSPVPGPKIGLFASTVRATLCGAVGVGVLAGAVALVVGACCGSRIDAPSGDERWRLDDLLVVATAASVALFFLLTLSNNPEYARYLDPVMIFSVIGAARILPRLVLRWAPTTGRVLLLPLLGLAVVAVSVFAVRDASISPPSPPTAALEHYLESHHLRRGLGDYWAASIVTVDTRSRVEVRPVVANLAHEIVPDGRNTNLDWFSSRTFQFLVYQSLPYGRVEPATIAKTFGAPQTVVRIGRYYVATWGHPLVLAGPPFP